MNYNRALLEVCSKDNKFNRQLARKLISYSENMCNFYEKKCPCIILGSYGYKWKDVSKTRVEQTGARTISVELQDFTEDISGTVLVLFLHLSLANLNLTYL